MLILFPHLLVPLLIAILAARRPFVVERRVLPLRTGQPTSFDGCPFALTWYNLTAAGFL